MRTRVFKAHLQPCGIITLIATEFFVVLPEEGVATARWQSLMILSKHMSDPQIPIKDCSEKSTQSEQTFYTGNVIWSMPPRQHLTLPRFECTASVHQKLALVCSSRHFTSSLPGPGIQGRKLSARPNNWRSFVSQSDFNNFSVGIFVMSGKHNGECFAQSYHGLFCRSRILERDWF